MGEIAGFVTEEEVCHGCDGAGSFMDGSTCEECEGTGNAEYFIDDLNAEQRPNKAASNGG